MISIDTSFEARLTADYLKAVGDGVGNIMPLLREQLAYYRRVAQPAIFAAHSEGKTGSGGHLSWKALTPQYLRSKLKKDSFHPKDLLQLTGAFADDLTIGTDQTVLIERASNDSAEIEFGSRRVYPQYAGAGNGGSRQAMYITADTQKHLVDMTNHFLSGVIVEKRKQAARIRVR